MGSTQSTHNIRKTNSNANLHTEAVNNQNTNSNNNIALLNCSNKLNIPITNDVLDQMSTQHFLYRHIWNSNFSSPVGKLLQKNDGCRVLDVGCGGGSWILDMATEYPKAQFIGIDAVPVYPQEIMPKNADFISADALKPLPFNEPFDFARLSLLGTCFTDAQWPIAINNIASVLKPGGYFEIVEHDLVPVHMGPIYRVFVTEFINFFRSQGINLQIVHQLKTILLQSDQFTQIEYGTRLLLVGKCGGQVGMQSASNLSIWFESILKPQLQPFMKLDEEEYDRMWTACKEELSNGETYYNIYRFWGRKL